MYSAICFKSEFTQHLSKVHFSNILLPTKSIPTLFQKKKSLGIEGNSQFIHPSKNFFLVKMPLQTKSHDFQNIIAFWRLTGFERLSFRQREACKQKRQQSICRMIVTEENIITLFKTCPSANMSITNLTRSRPGSNPGFPEDRLESNPWGMAEKVTRIVLLKYYFVPHSKHTVYGL